MKSKKLVSIVAVMAIIAIMMTVFCSCGDSQSKLVGTWYRVSGKTTVDTVTLYSDGTCSVDNESGTWTVVDNTLKILGSYGGKFWDEDSLVGEYEVSNDTLTIYNATIDQVNTTESIVLSKSPEKSNDTSKLYYLEQGGVIGIMGFENESCSSDIETLLLPDDYELEYIEISGDEVVIPEEINQTQVMAIDGGAFKNCTSIKSITIPVTVTVIEPGAFDGCSDSLVIYGQSGSSAETFANEEDIQFIAIEE
ncbi:MAG: leucine-rich repeat protein [Ruminococcus sp.]|nr:leucine-rich repeat protein [Ruminococcus sp.]